ncbi:hypothetical protein [Actinoplanes awajinensis]|uniref:Uncharacterized protein n=1 Tax=Actinoplanes awajinensis subsp. mycoplanecinus TaxID=135947 RepID=A0A101JRI4_9ACTN|nr:hypothetical protein [Actinoplanes awajinensis]KUL31712.1 hypothetical protein ADL15_21265 [Actinoplanes awajinensis subsp. mycoplanecinus]
MSAGLPQDINLIVIAVSATSSRAHLYPDVKTLLTALDGLVVAGGSNLRMEFFDKQGVRMHPVFGKKWQLVGIEAGVDGPEPEILLSRLRTAVTDIETYLFDPVVADVLAGMKLTPKQAAARLPRLAEVTDLAEALRRCDGPFGHADADPGDNGSPLHNLFVHGIL